MDTGLAGLTLNKPSLSLPDCSVEIIIPFCSGDCIKWHHKCENITNRSTGCVRVLASDPG